MTATHELALAPRLSCRDQVSACIYALQNDPSKLAEFKQSLEDCLTYDEYTWPAKADCQGLINLVEKESWIPLHEKLLSLVEELRYEIRETQTTMEFRFHSLNLLGLWGLRNVISAMES